MHVTRCGIGVLVFLSPLLKADGNCGAPLKNLGGKILSFTLIVDHGDDYTSFAAGIARLSELVEVPQYFSDGDGGALPFRAGPRREQVRLRIDPAHSQIGIEAKNLGEEPNVIDLNCAGRGTAMMTGTNAGAELTVALTLFETVKSESRQANVDSFVDEDIPVPPSRDAPLADKLKQALAKLTNPAYMKKLDQQEVKLNERQRLEHRIDALADFVSKK